MYENRGVPEIPRLEWKSLGWPARVRFACVACFGFMLAATVLSASRASMLMWFTSSKVDGVITREADPKNHNYVSYEYNVNGKAYSDTGYGPHHQDMQKGQTVEVYFFTPLPSESVIVAKDEQGGYAPFGLLAGVLMGVVAGFGDYWNQQRKSTRA
jgi:hypothetical protein